MIASHNSLALDLSAVAFKPSKVRGLIRKLKDIFFSSSSCSFVLWNSALEAPPPPYGLLAMQTIKFEIMYTTSFVKYMQKM